MIGHGRERGRWLCPVERGRYEEGRVMRNRLEWEACLPPGAMWHLGLGFWQGPCLGPVALLQLWSMLMSVAPIITKDLEDTQGLGHHIVPHRCHCRGRHNLGSEGMQMLRPWKSEWPELPPGPGCCPDPSCCLGPCLGPWLYHSQSPHQCQWLLLPLKAVQLLMV